MKMTRSGPRRDPINNKNQQSRSTRDLPLAPEFRDALTRHLLSCSPFQPIKSALHVERRLNSRTNSHLSSFIPASRAASPSSGPLARNVLYHVADAPSMERFMHMHILPALLCFITPMLVQCWHPNKPGGALPACQTLGALHSCGRGRDPCYCAGDRHQIYLFTGALHNGPHVLKTFLIFKTASFSLPGQPPLP